MGSKPKVVQQNPEADAAAAAEKATIEANAKKAKRRTANQSSVLGGLGSSDNTKTTLGGG